MKTVHLNIHDDLHQYLTKVKEEAGKTDYNIHHIRYYLCKYSILPHRPESLYKFG